jgi:hypothetical protein
VFLSTTLKYRDERKRTVILFIAVHGWKTCSLLFQGMVAINIQEPRLGFGLQCGERCSANTHTRARARTHARAKFRAVVLNLLTYIGNCDFTYYQFVFANDIHYDWACKKNANTMKRTLESCTYVHIILISQAFKLINRHLVD